MKVAIGLKLIDGPWGGGNAFARYLEKSLKSKGHSIVRSLEDNDIDCALLMDPRRNSLSASFNDSDLESYKTDVNPRVKIIHRVNECDERKGTKDVNQRLIEANRIVDHTVFVATWLMRLYEEQGIPCPSRSVILNGSDSAVFHSTGGAVWNGTEPFRLVTHHWGGNWMKSFDVYSRIDEWLGSADFRKRWDFTYVGNLPDGYTFKNAKYKKPLSGEALANELLSHHGYIAASINEPGSNHQNEGGCCGLPLLYRQSGCLPEYCEGFGVEYEVENLAEKLEDFRVRYPALREKMSEFPRKAGTMAAQHESLLTSLVGRK